MNRSRLAALLAALLLLPTIAWAAQAPIYTGPDGRPYPAQGVITLDSNGNYVAPGGGGGGGASTVTGSQEQDVRSSGTLNAASTASVIDIPINGQGVVGLRFSGLAASGATVSFFQSIDGGTTETSVNEVNAGTGVATATRSTDGQSRISASGRTNLKIRVSTAGTGTISVAWTVSVREPLSIIAAPLPPGANPMGFVGSGQYNTTLPTLAPGAYAYEALDVNGRAILSPQTTINAVQSGNWTARIDQGTPGTTNGVANYGFDGTTWRQLRTTTTGALEPPTAATGKVTPTSVALAANTNTTLVAANDQRIALEIQCDGTAPVGISRSGATLTSVAGSPLVIPAGSYPLYSPPVTPLTAITAYTGTAQTCRVTEYLR